MVGIYGIPGAEKTTLLNQLRMTLGEDEFMNFEGRDEIEVKEALVDHLKSQHHLGVWTFGDSTLDLKMLSRADKAFFVVGDEESRSRSMDEAFKNAIEDDGLKATQCLRPSHVPRLTTAIRPEFKLLDPHFVDSLLSGCGEPTKLNVISADKLNPGSVKILMTPMRDMSV
ncbi:hypothetical protein BDV38DRAFT_284125 [Aspergillus pseudotamarii]|uniref:Uncharacterized protein n=1 Tax=Aspergillus pseudotamarii TaxID=132259 RepID=A0A5N6SR33_ASPPS|nr:uncharacterized protein BDV38DRAFT_284125 [Aspergillus pseudotamarii]KAE8136377.1 hypothetical protein BDV38DRAFT_284125 [Aspergillus pseudotamarii]